MSNLSRNEIIAIIDRAEQALDAAAAVVEALDILLPRMGAEACASLAEAAEDLCRSAGGWLVSYATVIPLRQYSEMHQELYDTRQTCWALSRRIARAGF